MHALSTLQLKIEFNNHNLPNFIQRIISFVKTVITPITVSVFNHSKVTFRVLELGANCCGSGGQRIYKEKNETLPTLPLQIMIIFSREAIDHAYFNWSLSLIGCRSV